MGRVTPIGAARQPSARRVECRKPHVWREGGQWRARVVTPTGVELLAGGRTVWLAAARLMDLEELVR